MSDKTKPTTTRLHSYLAADAEPDTPITISITQEQLLKWRSMIRSVNPPTVRFQRDQDAMNLDAYNQISMRLYELDKEITDAGCLTEEAT